MRKSVPPFLLCLGFACLVLPSCSKSNRLPVYPVKGQVLVNGKGVKGVFVYFFPEAKSETGAYSPHAQTDEAGQFSLATYEPGDGAPAGAYVVTIEWPERYNVISGRWEGDKLKGRYSNPSSSQFRINIEKKPNELEPFQLK